MNNMEAIELRKKTDELERQVKLLIEQFVKEVGQCNIDIKTELVQFQVSRLRGDGIISKIDVKVNVTV